MSSPDTYWVACVQVYWLDLDYIKVARAALRCSAPFTAMLYLEYWCKTKYGRLMLLDVDLLNQVTHTLPCSTSPMTCWLCGLMLSTSKCQERPCQAEAVLLMTSS